MKYTGMIVEESLAKKDILAVLDIIDTKIEPVTKDDNTPWISQWTMHTVEVPEKRVDDIAEEIRSSLEIEHPWFVDFKNDEYHYIVFSGKIFKISLKNKGLFGEARKYGLSLGIPAHQLDFML